MFLEAEPGYTGEEIHVDDSVYDLCHGPGKVIEIKEQEGKFIVAFGHRRFVYRPTGVGVGGARRTLYWRYPVVAIPIKDDYAWDAYLEICEAAAKVLRSRATEISKNVIKERL